jgi:sugar phosphate isomerase/epimerase
MDLEGFVTLCADLGCDGVELTSYYFPSVEPDYLARLRRHLFRTGLAPSGAAVGGSFCEPTEEARAAHVASVKEWVDRAAFLGAPCLRVFAGAAPEGVTEEIAAGWVADGIRSCADYSALRGVMVTLENHGGLTATAEQTLTLLRAIDHEWVGLNLDCGNYRVDPYREIADTARSAVTVHAKVSSDSPSGRFVMDWLRVVETLRKAGFRGYLNVEFEEPQDPGEGVPPFLDVLKRALA